MRTTNKHYLEIPIGTPDKDGDVLMKEAMQIPREEIPIIRDFQANLENTIGFAKAVEKENKLCITCDLLTPLSQEMINSGSISFGIGFKILSGHFDSTGNYIIDNAKLLCVGVSKQHPFRNGDTIKKVFLP